MLSLGILVESMKVLDSNIVHLFYQSDILHRMKKIKHLTPVPTNPVLTQLTINKSYSPSILRYTIRMLVVYPAQHLKTIFWPASREGDFIQNNYEFIFLSEIILYSVCPFLFFQFDSKRCHIQTVNR